MPARNELASAQAKSEAAWDAASAGLQIMCKCNTFSVIFGYIEVHSLKSSLMLLVRQMLLKMIITHAPEKRHLSNHHYNTKLVKSVQLDVTFATLGQILSTLWHTFGKYLNTNLPPFGTFCSHLATFG